MIIPVLAGAFAVLIAAAVLLPPAHQGRHARGAPGSPQPALPPASVPAPVSKPPWEASTRTDLPQVPEVTR